MKTKLIKPVLPVAILLLLIALPLTATAYDFIVNGIAYKYNSDGMSVTVTYKGDGNDGYGYSSLSGVLNIPSSVSYNGDSCSVTSIGDCAFYGCSGLTLVVIPNSVTSIGNSAFEFCSGLTSVVIPNSVISIGDYAFGCCSGVETLVVESGNIAYDSRNNCNAIVETSTNTLIAGCKNTTVPNSVTSIGIAAFSACSALTSFTIPNSVTSIGESAFASCSGLTSIIIPNSVTSIGASAFHRCTALTSIVLTGYGPWFYNTYSHSGLSQIINQLKIINIGSGITFLDGFGFAPDVVNCYVDLPPTCLSNTFSNYDGELHVPTTASMAYITANYWQNFTNLNNDIIDKITLDQTEVVINLQDELQLTATATPNGNAIIIWSSTNPNVASVDNNGKVSAISQGECDIYAAIATNPAVYTRCHVKASYSEITSLVLSETELVLNQVGDTITLTATITPANSFPKPIWTSSDETIATVDDNGLVTAINKGECDITVTVLNKSATCHVTVTSAIVITLDMQSVTIKPNDIILLTPSFNPVETDIVAASSDANVAFARAITQNGVKKVQVVGVAVGTAIITVSSVDEKAIPTTCKVVVSSVVKGDVNGDGEIDVKDVTALISYILGTTPTDFVLENANVNCEGDIDVQDVTALINMILN